MQGGRMAIPIEVTVRRNHSTCRFRCLLSSGVGGAVEGQVVSDFVPFGGARKVSPYTACLRRPELQTPTN